MVLPYTPLKAVHWSFGLLSVALSSCLPIVSLHCFLPADLGKILNV